VFYVQFLVWQATSGYLTRVLNILARVLDEAQTSFDARCLALKWVQEVVAGLNSTPLVFTSTKFLGLIGSVISQGFYY
jgi:hypothetical protein